MSAVIFDLDGTLIDSLEDIAAAMNHTLRELSLPERSTAEIERFVGEGARMLVRYSLGERAAELEDEALGRFRKRYFAHLLVHTQPYPGVQELLRTLRERGTKTAVLSNKPDDATVEIVRALLPDHPFVEVRGERPGVPKKPDPTSALEIAGALGAAPASIFFVGDTPIDMHTATHAGMKAVGVLWGMRSRQQLEDAGCACCIERPAELLALLEG